MLTLSLKEIIPQVLFSPYVIGAALFWLFFGTVASNIARSGAVKRHPAVKKGGKPTKVKMPPKEKPALGKDEDTSELDLK